MDSPKTYKIEDASTLVLESQGIIVPKEEPREGFIYHEAYSVENKDPLALAAPNTIIPKEEPLGEIQHPEAYEIENAKLPILESPDIIMPEQELPEENQWHDTKLTCLIKETHGVAQYSKAQQCIHLKSGPHDHIRLLVTIQSPPKNKYFLDLYLKRTNGRYSQYPVDRCCKKHKKSEEENSYPMTGTIHDKLSLREEFTKGVLAESYQLPHTPLRFKTEHLITKNNEVCAEIRLSFPCNDSCAASSNQEFTPNKEQSRDMELVINLTKKRLEKNEIVCAMAIKVWLKAVVRHKDLVKKQRREPKGGQLLLLLLLWFLLTQ